MTGRFGELLLIVLLVLLLFGAGKLPKVMGEIAKGIKAFKDNITKDSNKEEDSESDNKDN